MNARKLNEKKVDAQASAFARAFLAFSATSTTSTYY